MRDPSPPLPTHPPHTLTLAQVKGSTDTVDLLRLLRPKVYIPLLK